MKLFHKDALRELGGPGSGNWGHAGIPGQRGGSAKGTGGVSKRPTDYKDRPKKTRVSANDEAYDKIVKERHQILLSTQSLDDARKNDTINEESDRAIYEKIKSGKDVIEVPKNIMSQKFGYEASEINGAPGAYSGIISKQTEKAVLFNPDDVKTREWIPKSLIKWSSKKD